MTNRQGRRRRHKRHKARKIPASWRPRPVEDLTTRLFDWISLFHSDRYQRWAFAKYTRRAGRRMAFQMPALEPVAELLAQECHILNDALALPPEVVNAPQRTAIERTHAR